MVCVMSEAGDALEDLGAAGALAGIEWAHRATYRRVLADYDPETGHNQAWLGTHAYIVLQDRLDRVFSCGRYKPNADDPEAGRDVLLAGILQAEFDSMPVVAPGMVIRSDVNGSPAWRYGDWRWLLASAQYGQSDRIPWPQRSPTKQRIAQYPSPDELTLFAVNPAGEPTSADLAEVLAVPQPESVRTLVLAHAVDHHTSTTELFIGRPRFNEGGGYAWHWKVSLLSSPSGSRRGGDTSTSQHSLGSDLNEVPDAPVRLRPQAADRPADQASGEQ